MQLWAVFRRCSLSEVGHDPVDSMASRTGGLAGRAVQVLKVLQLMRMKWANSLALLSKHAPAQRNFVRVILFRLCCVAALNIVGARLYVCMCMLLCGLSGWESGCSEFGIVIRWDAVRAE